MKPLRLATLAELAAEVGAAQLSGTAEPGQVRAATVLTDAMLRAFGRPSGGDWFTYGEAAGAWLSGLVFDPNAERAECPEA